MFKFRKISKVILPIIISTSIFISCSTAIEEIDTVRLNSVDEVIEKFNEYNLKNDILEMVKLYSDDYIDSTGTTLNYINSSLSQSRADVEITKSELIEIEDISDNIKKATLEIGALINGEEFSEQYTYAVIKEDDGWAISPDGVIDCQNYGAGVYIEDDLNLALGKKIELIDSTMLRISVLNDSKLTYTFGTEENKCEIIVETATETLSTTMDNPSIVEPDFNSYFLSRVDNLKDEIKKVTVTNIYEVDKDLNPINNSRQAVIIYSKE